MPNIIFQEIERLHSEWARKDNVAKLGWLAEEKIRISALMNQFAHYVLLKGGFSNDEERACAYQLLEMSREVDSEGSKVMNDLADDTFMEIIKSLMR